MIQIKCDYCGKTVFRAESKIERNKHNFCSEKCCNKFRHKRIKTSCDCCGKTYVVKQYDYNKSKNHFCSSNCYHQSTIKKIDSKKQVELGYIVGYVCGDGWISSYANNHLISIATIEENVVKTIVGYYKRVLPNNSVHVYKRHIKNKKIRGRKINSKEIFNIIVNSKELYGLIHKKDGKYSMPNILSEDGVKGFIAGLFDAEGSVCYNGKSTTLQIASKYIENLLPIQIQLKHFGIKSKVKEYNCGILYSCGKDIKTFYEKIPIANIRKKEKLKKIIDTTSFYKRYMSKQKEQAIEMFKDEKSFTIISGKLNISRCVLFRIV